MQPNCRNCCRRHPGRRTQGGLNQRGLTMVELMIAVVIGSFIMLGVIQLFSSMNEAYRLNESLSRVQENGRFAMDVSGSTMRMAGFQGCEGRADEVVMGVEDVPADVEYLLDFDRPLQGYRYDNGEYSIASLQPEAESLSNWSPQPEFNLDNAVPGSDIVTIRMMGGDWAGAQEGWTPNYDSGGVGSPPTFHGLDDPHMYEQDELILFCDFRGTAAIGRRGNQQDATQVNVAGSDLPELDNPVELAQPAAFVFYVGVGEDDSPALFQRRLTTLGSGGFEDEELVSGIELMRAMYGIDQDGNGAVDEYQRADEVDSADLWHQVVSVRMAFLARADQRLVLPEGAESATLSVFDEDIAIAEGIRDRQRRIFTTTIQVRN